MTASSRKNRGGEPLVLAFASLKGGVGKTATAVHVAGALAGAGLAVVLLDGDRIRTATAWSSKELLPFRVVPPTGLARAGAYDALVIDSAGGLESGELLELARTADLLLLPSPADLGALDGLSQTAELLAAGEVPSSKYAALLTRVRSGSGRGDQARAGLAALGVPALASQVRESVAVQDALAGGVLVNEVKGSSTATGVWADYQAVTAEAVEKAGEAL